MGQYGNFTIEPCGGIEGLFEITPSVYGDARGYFMETYQEKQFQEAGIHTVFVQENQSYSEQGVLRGLHFQKKHAQAKLVRAMKGEIFDVAVDLRPGSPTYGKCHGIILSEENKKEFYVPEGFAHGFYVLSESAIFAYKCSDYYHPESEDGIPWNDPALQVEWPAVPNTALRLSEKDKHYRPFERILLVGAAGQLGKELAERFVGRIVDVLTHSELNIADKRQVFAAVSKYKPTVVINAAAFTAVDRAETEQGINFAVNAEGAGYLAEAAEAAGAKFVHFSTDYIFDGKNRRPYGELEKAAPLNEYGKAKLQGEELVRSSCARHFIIRTSWVYGDGNNFVRTMLKLGERRLAEAVDGKAAALYVVDDQVGVPTSTKVLADVVERLLMTAAYGTYHASCSGTCSWYEFACEIMSEAGLDVPVEAVSTKEYNAMMQAPEQSGRRSAAERPAYSVLDTAKLTALTGYEPPEWKKSLSEFLHKID